jgi:hypothetical protein
MIKFQARKSSGSLSGDGEKIVQLPFYRITRSGDSESLRQRLSLQA